MFALGVKMARHRLSALLAVAVAVLGGAALITGTVVLAESGLRSHPPVGRLGGADVIVTADQSYHVAQDVPLALPERRPLPLALADRLADLPQVTAAVSDLSFPAAVVDRQGQVVPSDDPQAAGHGWASIGLLPGAVVDGAAPAGVGQVAVDRASATAAGVRIGDRLHLVVNGESARYRLTAVVDGAPAAVFFSDPAATRLAGREEGPRAGTVDLIGLHTAPGSASAVAGVIRDQFGDDGLVVATAAARGDAVAPHAAAARSTLVLIAGSLAGILVLIIGFVVAGAMAVSVHAQQQELALLRAVGATPAQVRHLAAGQATAVALLVMVPGIALGYLLAERFRSLLAHRGVIPVDLPLTVGPLPAIAAVLMIITAVQIAARVAAWRASRLPVTEAVARSRAETRTPSRVRTRAGVLLIAAAGVLSLAPVLSPTQQGAATTSLAGLCAAIGLAVAGPGMFRTVSERLVRLLPHRAGAATWLAVTNTASSPARVAATAAALAMTVVFVLTYALSSATVGAATSRQMADATSAQLTFSAAELGGVPADLLGAVRAAPGVQAAGPVGTTTVLWSHSTLGDTTVDSVPALVLTPAAPALLDLDVQAGDLTDLTGNTIAIGTHEAQAGDIALGETVRLVLGDGAAVHAEVVATYGRDLGFGPLVLSHDLTAGDTTTTLDQTLLVRTDGTASTHSRLARLLADRPGITLNPTAEGGGRLPTAPPEAAINVAVLAVLLVYLLLGVANKLAATTARRRSEFATLQLIGATPRQIRSMMRREATLLTAAATIAALLLSAVPLALVGIGFRSSPLAAGPGWLLPATVATVTAMAFLSIELPTRKALRANPLRTLSRPA